MRYFTSAVDAGSIRAAAERLYVAQPALGSQIRQLEAELGVALLERHSRGVRPTAAGRALYRKAIVILEEVQRARREMLAFAANAREGLTFGITPGIAGTLGSDMLVIGRELMPTIELSLVEELSYVLADAVARGDIDLALAYEADDRTILKRTALLREELIYAVSPRAAFLRQMPLGRGREITLTAALQYPLVQASTRDPTRRLIEAEAQRLSCTFNVVYQASSISSMKGIILAGEAAGILPSAVVRQGIESGELEWRKIVTPRLCRTLYLISPENRGPLKAEASVQAFTQNIVDRFARLQGDVVHVLAGPGRRNGEHGA